MADLRIVDAPLLSTVKGTEKLPTGGEGNFSVSVNQVADFAKLKWVLATEEYVNNAVGNVQADLNLHKNNESNPHNVTKTQVGLGNVDNTADLDKPISNASLASLLLKADKADLTASKISSDGGQTQQEINDFGGAKWYAKSGGYKLGATVKLVNGDVVKSTVANNIIEPNIDMTGWVNVNGASQIVDASGKTQQEINKLSKTVFNIAELKTISAGNGDVVRTSCHTVSGLGAGTYIFEALSSKTDNGGSYIASTKSAGIWVLISKNLYFEHFGVIPEQTDQSSKMTAAIDYALSVGIKKISFEKSNTYYYNNYVLIKPRLVSPAYVVTTTDFEIDLNDAVLKPISKGLKLFIIGRDLVSFRNFNATAQDIKDEFSKADKDSVAFCLGLPSDLAAAYPKETYRWSAQHCEFYNPKCAYFGEMFLFNPAWAVFYSYFENPIATSTYYMFAFAGNQTSTFMQVTRTTIISPKHIGGTCTFWLNCAETTKVFGGAAEFINYEDVYGRISTPTSIYEPQISEGIVVTSATQSHNVFNDFDIEHARSFVNMSGLHSDWRGRVFKLVDASDNEVTTQAGWLNAVTGKCFTSWRGWKKGEYGSLNVETFAGVSPSLNMISYKTKEDLSTTLMSHAMTASLSKNSLDFSLVGADLSASFYVDYGLQIKNIKALQFESPTLKTNDIRTSTGDSLRMRGATTNGAELNIAYHTDGSTVKLQAWNLGVGVRANLTLDMTSAVPYINNAVDLGSESLRFNRTFTKTLNYSNLVFDSSGAGSPEGVVSAGVGSTYRRVDGGAGTTFYVKESGGGLTGWVAK